MGGIVSKNNKSEHLSAIDKLNLNNDEEELLNKGENLLNELTTLALDLVDEYYLEFLRPDFCNRVALISKKLLLETTNEVEINGASHVLGLVSGETEAKEKLCEQIIKHYIDRVNLISSIIYSLEYCSDRLRALVVGPICTVNYDVFNKVECDEICGDSSCWIENNLINKDIDRNQKYFHLIRKIYDEFTKSIEKFQDALEKLKKNPKTGEKKSFSDEDLKNLSKEIHEEIYKVKTSCNELYYSALLNPPKTSQEIEQNNYYENLKDKLTQQVKDATSQATNNQYKQGQILANQVAQTAAQGPIPTNK